MAGIIFLIIIIILIVLLGKSNISLRYNIQFWLIAGYILLLLASPVVIQLLPQENFAEGKMKTLSNKDLYNRGDLYTMALEARPEQTEGVFVLGKWELPYNGSMINVVEGAGNEYGATIMVEKKDSADGKIEAVNYATKAIVGRIDFSEFMKPHRVTLDGNVLKITAPEHLKIELGMFGRESVVSQILGDTGLESAPWVNSTQLLYLRVPADVEVRSEADVQFVNKQ